MGGHQCRFHELGCANSPSVNPNCGQVVLGLAAPRRVWGRGGGLGAGGAGVGHSLGVGWVTGWLGAWVGGWVGESLGAENPFKEL